MPFEDGEVMEDQDNRARGYAGCEACQEINVLCRKIRVMLISELLEVSIK